MKKAVFILASLCVGSGLLGSCGERKTADTSSTGATAPAGPAGGMAGMDHSQMPAGAAANTSAMAAALNTIMKDMEAFRPGGNTDHDFARMMTAHHRRAVEMSALELREGHDATLRAMAQKISADQQQEIKALDAIAARLGGDPANYQPQDSTDPFASAMKTSMVGMMNTGQPTGNADADYALLMVPHHQSAVDMAKAEVAHGRDARLKDMARGMIEAQEKEIQQFKNWQAKNGGKVQGAAAAVYECPMGDGGKGTAPGKCPKCGMELAQKG